MCHTRFENIIHLHVELDLVVIDDVDKYTLQRSDNTGTVLNKFLVE